MGRLDRNQNNTFYEDDFMIEISESLKMQVEDELGYNTTDIEEQIPVRKKKRVLKAVSLLLGSILICAMLLVFTKPGQNLLIKLAAVYIDSKLNTAESIQPTINITPEVQAEEAPVQISNRQNLNPYARQEEQVINILLFGIEEIKNARNTDTMMVASINTETKEIKLISLLRDTYVDIPGYSGNKLNAVYSKASDRTEGAELLMQTIENTYHIDLDAYMSVNFDSLEQIIDKLGGITIELGDVEAAYLNRTNYISNPAYRNVKAGVQVLNGNQTVGYCRVRKVSTLGGENNDYGRTLRHRRVINAIVEKCKTSNIIDLLSLSDFCFQQINSDISKAHVEEALKLLLDSSMSEIESARLPIEGHYYDTGKTPYNGHKYVLVLDDDGGNTKELYKMLYGDTQEEAEANYLKYTQ